MQIIKHDGKVIAEPGIYSGIHIEDYHSNPFLCDGPSISSSGLRTFIERPSKYWAFSPYNAKRFPKKSNASFDFGKAAHHLLLEGAEGFARQFAVSPFEDFRSAAARQWRDEQIAKRKPIVTTADLEAISRIRDSLDRHPVIQGGLLDGDVEMSMVARFGRIWLRARPDVVPRHAGDFADLKTTNSIIYDDLERSIYQYGYHVQAAVVRMVARAVMGEGFTFNGFAFVFVEKEPPYDVRIVQLKPDAIDLGEKQVRLALRDFERCIERMDWPGEEGDDPGIGYIGLPSWATPRIETAIRHKELQS
jgi:hypothetical protein